MRVSKAQFHKGKYGTKMGFPKGVGVQAKKPSLRGVWIFSGTTHSAKAFLKTDFLVCLPRVFEPLAPSFGSLLWESFEGFVI